MLQLLGSSPCGRASATLTQGSNGLASTLGGHEVEFLLSSAERVRVCTRLPVSLARKGHGLLVAWRLVHGELPARPIRCLLFLDFLARLCVWAGNGLVSRSHLLLFVSTEGQCLALRNRSATDQWTHWGLNPRPSACEADVIPLHHVPLASPSNTRPKHIARCARVCTSQRVSTCACACVCACACACMRACIRVCVVVRMRVRMCVLMHVRMCVRMCVCMRMHMCACTRARMCVRTCAHVRASRWARARVSVELN